MKKIKPGYIFIAPFIIFYLITGVFPIMYTLYISFFEWNGYSEMVFVGGANYIQLLTTDPLFWKAIQNTLIISGFAVPISMAIGLVLASALHSSFLKMKKLFQVINFLPYLTAPAATGIIFAFLFSFTNGIINKLLMNIGVIDVGINWLGYETTARLVVIIISIWKSAGYQMIFFLAGLATVPGELYEVAAIEGANAWQKFIKVTIPSISGVFKFLIFVSIIGGLQLIQEPMLLFNSWASGSAVFGGPNRSVLTAIWYMYDTTFNLPFNYGKGAAISYSLFMIIALILFIVRVFIPRMMAIRKGAK